MSQHHNAPKVHEPHTLHEEPAKGPHDLKEINPKMTSDIAYWSKEFGVTGAQLHEAIRSHGTT
jgi:Protein of unknown function (DUF3606)